MPNLSLLPPLVDRLRASQPEEPGNADAPERAKGYMDTLVDGLAERVLTLELLVSAYKNASHNLVQGHPELLPEWRRLQTQYGITTEGL